MARTDLDHAIVLQVERGLEALADRVERTEEQVAICDCDCGAGEVGELQGDVEELRDDIAQLRVDLTKTRERLADLLHIFIEHLESAE